MSKQVTKMTVEELLAIPDAETVTQDVDLSAFGGGLVTIRQFSIADQVRIRREAMQPNGEPDQHQISVLTLNAGLVEPAVTLEQAEALMKKRFGMVQHLLDAMHQLSGLTALLGISRKAVDDTERRFRKR